MYQPTIVRTTFSRFFVDLTESLGIWLVSLARWMRKRPERTRERMFFFEEQKLALTNNRQGLRHGYDSIGE
jgi:hypothetical protein